MRNDVPAQLPVNVKSDRVREHPRYVLQDIAQRDGGQSRGGQLPDRLRQRLPLQKRDGHAVKNPQRDQTGPTAQYGQQNGKKKKAPSALGQTIQPLERQYVSLQHRLSKVGCATGAPDFVGSCRKGKPYRSKHPSIHFRCP